MGFPYIKFTWYGGRGCGAHKVHINKNKEINCEIYLRIKSEELHMKIDKAWKVLKWYEGDDG